ncbi:SDR family NAD(P)-dependent oxidoreductase [Aspergillus stella-maris]|uniref:SDR family NAD(P)-dependent oxidoreductase n=1 Tax=Aspergillus stella-maris TaxID=1810926 RepID=UPI003CCD8D5A
MSLLRNKVIVVTGSSSGIGRAIASSCAEQEAVLALHHLGISETEEDVRALKESLPPVLLDGKAVEHLIIGIDLTSDDAADTIIDQTVSAFGRVDALVNNAGICTFSPATSVTKPLLQRHIDVNYTATYLLTQAATQQMIQQRTGGSIVSISSITAVMGHSNLTHYAGTKAAVLGMSKSMAVEFGKHNIRYNCILPGTIQTDMNAAHLAAARTRDLDEALVPLGRLGEPGDVAGVAVFLASDLAKYVNGEQILVDGGAAINYQ